MKRTACLLILAFTLLVPALALEGGNIPLSPRPSWIDPIVLDTTQRIGDAQVDYGFYYILNDQQTLTTPRENYRHYAFRIINNAGLEEASRIEISFEPSYQTLSMHGFTVYRDGKAIAYDKRVRWKELQREESLESGLYDESKTMVLILEDVRKGDVIEYDYTIRGSNPIFGAKIYESFGYGLDYPMQSLRYRVVVPKGRTVAISQHVRTIPYITRVLRGGATEYVWAENDSPAILHDSGTPEWYDEYPWIELSEWRDWAEVAAWGRKVFAAESPASEARTDAAVRAAYERVIAEYGEAKASLSAEDKLLACLRFTQDEIRYFGIEIGVNSHQPRRPEEVLDSRFGDCKDKARLFCRLARLAGWDATPVLANTTHGKVLGDWLPSPTAFNHVIALVRAPEGDWWFDPTISYQGGLIREVWVPDYGQVLPLDGTPGALAPMAAERVGNVDIRETYTSVGYDQDATLEVLTTYRGREADRMRYSAASTGSEKRDKKYLEFYQSLYPKTQRKGEVTIEDRRDENEVLVRESYSIADLWQASASDKDGPRSLYVYPHAFSEDFSSYDDIGSDRKSPLGLYYPWKVRHRIVINLPENLNVETESYAADNQWYRFSYAAEQVGLAVDLDYEYEPLVDMVQAADFPAFRETMEKDRATYLGYTLTEKKPDAAGTDDEPTIPLYAAFVGAAVLAFFAYRLGLKHGDARRSAPPGGGSGGVWNSDSGGDWRETTLGDRLGLLGTAARPDTPPATDEPSRAAETDKPTEQTEPSEASKTEETDKADATGQGTARPD